MVTGRFVNFIIPLRFFLVPAVCVQRWAQNNGSGSAVAEAPLFFSVNSEKRQRRFFKVE